MKGFIKIPLYNYISWTGKFKGAIAQPAQPTIKWVQTTEVWQKSFDLRRFVEHW
jgi:hypothetical protein